VDAVDSVEGWVTCSQSLDAVSDAASDTVSIAVMSTTEELFCVELVYGKKKEEFWLGHTTFISATRYTAYGPHSEW